MSNAHADNHQHHVMPIPVYLGVFGALLVLTVITVAVSYMNLGRASILVAMVVALIKAGFVVGYFMHLKYDTRLHQLVFFSSLFFMLIFFGITFIDLSSRKAIVADQGTFEYRNDQVLVEISEEAKAISDRKAKATKAADKAG